MTETQSNGSSDLRVAVKDLRTLIVQILEQQGMFGFEADMSADRMIEADLRGVSFHGVASLCQWIERIAAGDVDPRAQTVTLTETPAMAVLDVNKGMGHVGATHAMKMAIKKAKEVGTATVATIRGHQFGSAANYALLAANAGMIGYCTSSSGPATVAHPDSAEPATANHTFAWAVPNRDGAPIVVESQYAKLAWEDIHASKNVGDTLDPHCAFDGDGAPTVDPAMAVTLLPAGGELGFGLGLIASVLTGPLIGRKAAVEKTRRPESEGYEHFFYVLDVAHFTDLDAFHAKLDTSLERIGGLTPLDEDRSIGIPGRSEWERSERLKTEGIPLPPDVVEYLSDLAAKKGFDVPW